MRRLVVGAFILGALIVGARAYEVQHHPTPTGPTMSISVLGPSERERVQRLQEWCDAAANRLRERGPVVTRCVTGDWGHDTLTPKETSAR